MAKKSSAPTKSDILAAISKDTWLPKKQVSAVFDSLNTVIKKSLKSNGMFTLPGLAKMKVVKKPATKAKTGINPLTKEPMTIKAKPAQIGFNAIDIFLLLLDRVSVIETQMATPLVMTGQTEI